MGSGSTKDSAKEYIVRWLSLLVPACIVVTTGLVYTSFVRSKTSASNVAVSTETSNVQIGKDYYVSIALLELSERDREGQAWDSYNNSGPDIFVEVYWKGSRVYRSTTKEDSFVAKWSSAELDVRKMALTGQTASLDGLIQAARINIRSGETISIRAYDADLVDSDEAGERSLRTTDLKIGDTTYDYAGPGIRRMVVRVADMSEPVDVTR